MRFLFLISPVFLISQLLHAVITPASLPDGTEGINYPRKTFTSDQVSANNSSVRWRVLNAPPGITIDSRGNYGGKPTKAGNYSVTISVSIAQGTRLLLKDSFTIAHSINATVAPDVDQSVLPRAKFDARYQPTAGFKLTATGGVPFAPTSRYPSGYMWETIRGAGEFQNLPAGMTLSSVGVVSGVPTSRAPIPASVQTYVFKVKITDLAGKVDFETFTLVVDPADPPEIITQCPLPDGLEQTVYKNHTLVGIKGKPPYHWTILPSSSFPPGLKVDHRTGVISGKPTTSGNFTFTLNLRDANGLSDNKSCAINIHPIPRITTNSIVEWDCATPGKNLPCATITAIGGNPPYKWEIIPPVENLNITTLPPNQARICGNFTSAGVKQVTVKVTDNKTSKFTMKTFTVPVYPPLQITTQCPLPTGKTFEDYSASFTAVGGKSPYTWEILPQIYVADFSNNMIRKFNEEGLVKTFAGNGINQSIDGNLANSSFQGPYGIEFDEKGNLYVADRKKIRKISNSGNVITLKGNFSDPEDMLVDTVGNVYVSDSNQNNIKKINSAGNVSIFVGNSTGLAGWKDGVGLDTNFRYVQGIDWDLDGNIILTDCNNHRVRKISPFGDVSTIAGNGIAGLSNGVATQSMFHSPHDVKVHHDGVIYVLDHGSAKVRKVFSDGTVTTLQTDKPIVTPWCLSLDKSGNVYVSDGTTNHNIVKITPNGNLTTIAGSGYGLTNGVPPLQAQFRSPRGVEINPYEDLPIGLTLNSSTGVISGTPEEHGLYNLTYRVTDSCGNTAISNCTLTIDPITAEPEFDFQLPWQFTDSGALAAGHDGSDRSYTSDNIPPGGLWSVSDDNLTSQVTWENSKNCGGSNANLQTATATINIKTLIPQKIGLSWDGVGELQESDFDMMEVYINGILIGSAHAAGGGQGCKDGPVVSVANFPAGFNLPAGIHTVTINATTNDGLYHTNSFFRFKFTLIQ